MNIKSLLICLITASVIIIATLLILAKYGTEGQDLYADHAELPAVLKEDIPACATNIYLYYHIGITGAEELVRFDFKPDELDAVRDAITTYKSDEIAPDIYQLQADFIDGLDFLNSDTLPWWDYAPADDGIDVFKIDNTNGADKVHYHIEAVKSKCYITRKKG